MGRVEEGKVQCKWVGRAGVGEGGNWDLQPGTVDRMWWQPHSCLVSAKDTHRSNSLQSHCSAFCGLSFTYINAAVPILVLLTDTREPLVALVLGHLAEVAPLAVDGLLLGRSGADADLNLGSLEVGRADVRQRLNRKLNDAGTVEGDLVVLDRLPLLLELVVS